MTPPEALKTRGTGSGTLDLYRTGVPLGVALCCILEFWDARPLIIGVRILQYWDDPPRIRILGAEDTHPWS